MQNYFEKKDKKQQQNINTSYLFSISYLDIEIVGVVEIHPKEKTKIYLYYIASHGAP